MANTLKFKRGTDLSNAGTPSAGEPVWNSSTNKLYIGDGSTSASSLTQIGAEFLPLAGGTLTGNLTVGLGSVDQYIDLKKGNSDKHGIIRFYRESALEWGIGHASGEGSDPYQLTSGTEFGIWYGSSPSYAMYFDTSKNATFASDLTITSELFITNRGSASAPAIRFGGDGSSGIYSGSSAEFGYAHGGSQKFLVNSSGDGTFAGTVGVGGATVGTFGIRNASSTPTLYFHDESVPSTREHYLRGHYSSSANTGNAVSFNIENTAGSSSEIMRVSNAGVGIGTDSASDTLHLEDGNNTKIRFSYGSGLYINQIANEWDSSTSANNKMGFHVSTGHTSNTVEPLTLKGDSSATFAGDVSVSSSDPTITIKRSNSSSYAGHLDFTNNADALGWQVGTNQVTGDGFEVNYGTANKFYLTTSGNATFTGTIGSGAITSTGGITGTTGTFSGDIYQSTGKFRMERSTDLLSGAHRKVQIFNDSSVFIDQYSYNGGYNALNHYRSNHASIGSFTATADGDILGTINWHGTDSGNSKVAIGCAIDVRQDGNAGADYTPSKLAFYLSNGSNISSKTLELRADQSATFAGTISNTGLVSSTGNTAGFKSINASTTSKTTQVAYDGLYTNGAQNQFISSDQEIKFYPGGVNKVTMETDGTVQFVGTATFQSNTTFAEYLKHDGDSDTFIRFTDNAINFSTGNSTALSLGGTVSGNTVRGATTFDSDVTINSAFTMSGADKTFNVTNTTTNGQTTNWITGRNTQDHGISHYYKDTNGNVRGRITAHMGEGTLGLALAGRNSGFGDLFLDSSGNATFAGAVEVEGNLTSSSSDAYNNIIFEAYHAGVGTNSLVFRKSNHASNVIQTTSGQISGMMHFQGVDTNNAFVDSASIIATQDGSSASGRAPTKLSFSTSSSTAFNTDQFVLNSNNSATFAGNVGIGVTANHELQVNGNIVIKDDGYIGVRNTANTDWGYAFKLQYGDNIVVNPALHYDHTTVPFGNVGIGVGESDAVNSKLIVRGISDYNLWIGRSDIGNASVIDSINNAENTRMPLWLYGSPVKIGGGNLEVTGACTFSADVGIGVSPSSGFLHVEKSSDGGWLSYMNNTHAGGYGLKVKAGSDSGDYAFVVESQDSSTHWFRVTGDGNSLFSGQVNLTTTTTGSLDIITSGSGNAPNDGKLYISKTSNADWFMKCESGNDDYGIKVHGNGTYGIAVSQHDASYRARISYNGYIYSTDGLVHDIDSDERLKENVSNADSQWQLFKDLPLQKFKWIDRRHGDGYSHGWIAQEVQEKYPDLVEQVPQPKEDIDAGLVDEEYLTVKTGIIQRLGLKALQEAMEKIETLEAKVTALENA